jgi:hypothetical protein
MAYDASKYETVDDRLARLHADPRFADVRIVTVNHTTPTDRQSGMWVVECRIYLNAAEQANECPVATGWAFEIDGQAGANKTSALENCETSSRGRAMQALAMSGSRGGPTRTEMEKVERGVTPQSAVPDGFVELITSTTTLEDLKALWLTAVAGGYHEQVKQMVDNRKKVLENV